MDESPEEIDYWEAHPDPSEEEIMVVCRAWVRYQETARSDVDEDDPDWWAAEALMDLDGRGRPNVEWTVIRCLCSLVDSEAAQAVGMIGAGPLEDFLRKEGDRAMDLVEPAANSDPILLAALAGVWGWDEPVRPRIDRYLAARGRPLR